MFGPYSKSFFTFQLSLPPIPDEPITDASHAPDIKSSNNTKTVFKSNIYPTTTNFDFDGIILKKLILGFKSKTYWVITESLIKYEMELLNIIVKISLS